MIAALSAWLAGLPDELPADAAEAPIEVKTVNASTACTKRRGTALS
jgi:hypothetical protein